jgi:hypothetical protein
MAPELFDEALLAMILKLCSQVHCPRLRCGHHGYGLDVERPLSFMQLGLYRRLD